MVEMIACTLVWWPMMMTKKDVNRNERNRRKNAAYFLTADSDGNQTDLEFNNGGFVDDYDYYFSQDNLGFTNCNKPKPVRKGWQK